MQYDDVNTGGVFKIHEIVEAVVLVIVLVVVLKSKISCSGTS